MGVSKSGVGNTLEKIQKLYPDKTVEHKKFNRLPGTMLPEYQWVIGNTSFNCDCHPFLPTALPKDEVKRNSAGISPSVKHWCIQCWCKMHIHISHKDKEEPTRLFCSKCGLRAEKKEGKPYTFDVKEMEDWGWIQ